MEGEISLAEFISKVKNELVEAVEANRKDKNYAPFFTLDEVELKTEFGLKAEAGAGWKFFIDLSAKAEASQLHSVTLKFKPIPLRSNRAISMGARGGGDGGVRVSIADPKTGKEHDLPYEGGIEMEIFPVDEPPTDTR